MKRAGSEAKDTRNKITLLNIIRFGRSVIIIKESPPINLLQHLLSLLPIFCKGIIRN
jgi:hypothetical protein